ncbi:MAG: hypothetical protein MMC23_009730 [Stictis urceolatum]|nr:hypothetical protein [Stictis urceolata]
MAHVSLSASDKVLGRSGEETEEAAQREAIDIIDDKALLDLLGPKTKIINCEANVRGLQDTSQSHIIFNAVVERLESSESPELRLCVKHVEGNHAEDRVRGEYYSLRDLYSACSTPFVPKPYGYGKLSSSEGKWFLLAEAHRLDEDKEHCPTALIHTMRTLQQESLSPTDKLGYSTPTYIGTKMQTHGWDASWPTFFSKLLITAMVCDAEANSTVEELDTKLSKVCNQVIPILLGALEENGRKLKPVLIHGNLTDSRFRKLPNKEDVYFYNPSSYYSHQAMELASWDWFEDKPKWKPYIAEFKESGLASEPIEQFGGRDRLYRLKHKLYRSTLYGPGDERKQVLKDLNCFLAKYASPSEEV